MIWMLVASLLLLSAALLLWNLLDRQRQQALVNQRLFGQAALHQPSALRRQLQRLGQQPWAQRVLNLDHETAVLLNRVGSRRTGQRALFIALQLGAPLLLLALAALYLALRGDPMGAPWVLYLLALGSGWLLPKRVLASLAARRQQRLVGEVSIFIPLIRILFGAGLTVEQALRVLSHDGQQLLPIFTSELRLLLQHVDSGLDLAEELRQLGLLLEVDELSDCLAILRQLLSQGGGAMASLLALKKLLDDRRLTALQEKVAKLSAKMSVVMMVFLFPALLIVLAGPGFTAIGRALGSQ